MSVTENVGPYEVIVAGDGTVEVVTVGTPGPPGPPGDVGPVGPQGPAGADAAAVIDAPGDLIVGDATGAGARLPLGAVGNRFRIKQGDVGPTWDTGERVNVRDYGATADGTTNDVVAIQAAIDAAVAAGGGIVFLPSGTYKVTTPIQLKPGVILRGAGASTLGGATTVTTISGTAGQHIISLPSSGTPVGLGVEDLVLSGGLNGIYAPAGPTPTTYVRLRDLHISNPSQSCIEVVARIEEWDLTKVTLYGGQYGYRYTAPRMDKCTFTDVECRQQSVNGFNIATSEFSTACTWINLRLHQSAQHAFVQSASAGAVRNWVFVNPYAEGTGTSGKSNKTTGSITTGTTALTVANGTAFADGDPVVVAGAGTTGADLITTIASGGGTVNLVTQAAAGTTVSGAEVINARYDEFNFGSLIGGVSFLNGGSQGDSGGGHVRYGIYAPGFAYGLQLLNYFPNRPVYDPGRFVENVGRSNVRQPNNLTSYNLTHTFLAGPASGEYPRTLIPSPPGKDTVLALRDSADNTTGTFGNFEVRRNDSLKNVILQVVGANREVRTYGRLVEQGLAGGWSTIPAGTTTPDVGAYSYHKTANSAPTTITNFLNGIQPQTITIHCVDANTTIANNATIATNTGASKLLTTNRIYRFTLSGTVWVEDA